MKLILYQGVSKIAELDDVKSVGVDTDGIRMEVSGRDAVSISVLLEGTATRIIGGLRIWRPGEGGK